MTAGLHLAQAAIADEARRTPIPAGLVNRLPYVRGSF